MAKTFVILHEPYFVNTAAAWNEGYRLLLGEVWTASEVEKLSNPYSDV
jgi:hypothetical protein